MSQRDASSGQWSRTGRQHAVLLDDSQLAAGFPHRAGRAGADAVRHKVHVLFTFTLPKATLGRKHDRVRAGDSVLRQWQLQFERGALLGRTAKAAAFIGVAGVAPPERQPLVELAALSASTT